MPSLFLRVEPKIIPKVVLVTLVASLAGQPLPAASGQDQWPDLLGPQRQGQIAGPATPLPDRLPAGPLQPLWQLAVGQGYAGVSVRDSQVALFQRQGDTERLSLHRLSDGGQLWQVELPAGYRGGIDADRGPRCVPVQTDRLVIIYGAAGDLAAVERATGEVRWRLPLREQFRAEDGYFGAGSTPLVLEDRVIVNVGGARSGGIVAVALEDGRQLWASGGFQASYAGPQRLPHPTRSLVLVPTRLEAVGLDAADGRELFRFPFGSRGPTVNAATPIQVDDQHLLLTASYGVGATLIGWDPTTAQMRLVYQGSPILESQYATPVMCQGRLFGSNGREDVGQASYRCIDPLQQRLIWEQAGIGVAHSLSDAAHVLVVGIDGRLHLLDPTSDRWQPISESRLPEGTYRALPAWADGLLIVRDSQPGRQRLLAFPLAPSR
jgi:outer membrane protein assembly factor BamB